MELRKTVKLPVLIDHLKIIAEQHVLELQKAVINRGEWHFTSSYQFLQITEISDVEWFSLDQRFKEKHMLKVQKYKLVPTIDQSIAPSTLKNNTLSLSIPVQHCGISHVSHSTLQNIWKKAEDILQWKGSVLKAPWLPGDCQDWLKVLPLLTHMLLRKVAKTTIFIVVIITALCTNYKGFPLCSHVIAAAEHNRELKSFLDNLKDSGKLNLTAIANQGLPKGAGRKGGVQKRKRSSNVPIETRSVR